MLVLAGLGSNCRGEGQTNRSHIRSVCRTRVPLYNILPDSPPSLVNIQKYKCCCMTGALILHPRTNVPSQGRWFQQKSAYTFFETLNPKPQKPYVPRLWGSEFGAALNTHTCAIIPGQEWWPGFWYPPYLIPQNNRIIEMASQLVRMSPKQESKRERNLGLDGAIYRKP